MTWHAAATQAQNWGGRLVTIRSKAEHDWLWTQYPGADAWIGYSDAAQKGTWEWSSGESSGYTNWASGQPDNAGNIEHYAHLWAARGGQWNDDDPSALRPGIVEVRARSSYTVFGQGCAGAATPPSLKAVSPPRVGSLLTLEFGKLKPGTGGVLIVGNSDQSWTGIPLPLDLGFFGMPQCQLLVSWVTEVGFFSVSGGTLRWSATLPNDPLLVGRGFFNQVWVLDASANARGIATSNGAQAVIGW